MPRAAPSEKLKEAEELFLQGMAMVDIAKRLEVSILHSKFKCRNRAK